MQTPEGGKGQGSLQGEKLILQGGLPGQSFAEAGADLEEEPEPSETDEDDGGLPEGLYSMCTGVGSLGLRRPGELQEDLLMSNDRLLYFRIIKCFALVFAVLAVLSLPVLLVYSGGEMRNKDGWALSNLSLGKIGEASVICKQVNLLTEQTVHLICPTGSSLQAITMFGLQRPEAAPGDNFCPETIAGFGIQKIQLDLDPECSASGMKKGSPKEFGAFERQADERCLDQQQCFLSVLPEEWPPHCQEKINASSQGSSAASRPTDSPDQSLAGAPPQNSSYYLYIVSECWT